MVTIYYLVSKNNEVCALCKKYGIRWKMDLKHDMGLTIYSNKNDNIGRWFPITCYQQAEQYVLLLAKSDSTSQTTLNQFY